MISVTVEVHAKSKQAPAPGALCVGRAPVITTPSLPYHKHDKSDMPSSSSGFWHAFANLLKTMIGSGLLTLPYVTAQVGLGFSVVGLFIIALLTQAAIRLVVRCVVHERQLAGTTYLDIEHTGNAHGMHGSSSWQLVSKAAFGRFGWYVTCASLVTAQLGVVSSYLDFVGNTSMAYLGLSALSSRLLLWLVCSVTCMLRKLRNVAVLSMAALCVYAYIIVLVGVFGADALPTRDEPLEWFNPSKFGAWFGPALFAFEGMGTLRSPLQTSLGHVACPPNLLTALGRTWQVPPSLFMSRWARRTRSHSSA